jgi:hypothetical protein
VFRPCGPTFAGAGITGDADLVVDGLLLDFKSTRHALKEMSQRTAWQLTSYLLLDVTHTYWIDTVGLYLTRSGVLASWPVEDFLALLGACRRDLTELRGVFADLLTGCNGQADIPYFATEEETERVQRLLQRLAPGRLLPSLRPAPARHSPAPQVLHHPVPRARPGPSAPRAAARRPAPTALRTRTAADRTTAAFTGTAPTCGYGL